MRDLFDVCCSHHGIVVEPALSGNSMSTMLGFAQYNGGIALSSRLLIRNLLQSGHLHAVPLRERDLIHALSIEICTLSGRLLPAATKAFLSYLHRSLNETDPT
ncbi:LysR substrate binding domain protein [compost metagenome]